MGTRQIPGTKIIVELDPEDITELMIIIEHLRQECDEENLDRDLFYPQDLAQAIRSMIRVCGHYHWLKLRKEKPNANS